MATYHRKRNVILCEDKKTVAFNFVYINEAKRESLKLQHAGHIVHRMASKGGRK